MSNPLETRPQSVAIVALGPSNHDYVAASCSKKGFLNADEVWLVNSAINIFKGDKCFIMDDLKRCEKRFPEWGSRLRSTGMPIITSRAYPEFPTSVAYPIEEVCNHFQDDYMTGTVAYMIAYALLIKVQTLYLFGCDYWYPGSKAVEPGMECVTYFLGIAKERGVDFKIPQSSVLLDAHMTKFSNDPKTGKQVRRRPMYGYDYNPGEAQARISAGKGTELDQLVAHKAPSRLPDMPGNKAPSQIQPIVIGKKAEVKPAQSEVKVHGVQSQSA